MIYNISYLIFILEYIFLNKEEKLSKNKFSKQMILDASFEILKEKGIEFITAREIAKKLNSSVIPIFSNYANMEELRIDLMQKASEIYSSYISEGEQCSPKFKGTGLAYIKFAKNEPNLFKFIFMHKTPTNKSVMEDFCNGEHISEHILEIVQKSTNLTAKNAQKLYFYNWLFVHSIACMVATDFCTFSDEEISEMVSFEYVSLLEQFKKVEKPNA